MSCRRVLPFQYLYPVTKLLQFDSTEHGWFPVISHHRVSPQYYVDKMAPSLLCLDAARLLELERRGGSRVKSGIPRSNAEFDPSNHTSANSSVSAGTIAAVATGCILVVAVIVWLLWYDRAPVFKNSSEVRNNV
jgi:hypothetical protein